MQQRIIFGKERCFIMSMCVSQEYLYKNDKYNDYNIISYFTPKCQKLEYWGESNIQHGDYYQQYCIIYLKVAESKSLKFSNTRRKKR